MYNYSQTGPWQLLRVIFIVLGIVLCLFFAARAFDQAWSREAVYGKPLGTAEVGLLHGL